MNPIAKHRLHPTIFHPIYLHLRRLAESVRDVLAVELRGRSDCRVLDLGCGAKVYETLFNGIARHYIGVDIQQNDFADCIADGCRLPFVDETFDVVISTQVLEHVENPSQMAEEIRRVLKFDGLYIVSTPGMFPIHGCPDDFWRWTDKGLERFLSKFRKCRVIPNGGNLLCASQLFNIFVYSGLNKLYSPLRYLAGFPCFFSNLAGLVSERTGIFAGKEWVINYTAVARK